MNDAEARQLQNAYNTLSRIENPSESELKALESLKGKLSEVNQQVSESNATWRGVQNGGTLGLLDEAAGAKSFIQGDGYKSGRDAVRNKDREALTAHPEAFNKGQMAGGGMTMAVPALGWAKATQGMGMAGRSAIGAMAGGAIGGNQGVQDAQIDGRPLETLKDYWDAAKAPAGVGVGVGALAAPLAHASGEIVRSLRGLRHAGVEGLNKKSTKIMSSLMDRTQGSGRDIQKYLDEITPEAMLADVPELRQTARGLATMNGEGGMSLSRKLNERAAANGERIEADMNKHIAQPDAAFNEQRRLAQERTSILGPEYDAALSYPDEIDINDVAGMLSATKRDAARSVSNATDGLEREFGIKAANDSTDPTALYGPRVSATKLHNVRSDLSDSISEASQSGRGKFAVSMSPVLKALDDKLDTVPGYANARTGYANNKAMERAIEDGTGALRGGRVSALSPQELKAQFDGLSDAQKDAFRAGMRRDIAGLMGTSKNDAASAWGEFAKNWNEEKLRIVMGDEVGSQIAARLKSEHEFSKTLGQVTAGSDTNRGKAAMDALQPAVEPGTGRQQSVISRVKESVFDKPVNSAINATVYGPRASRTNADIGRALSATGEERDKIVQALLSQATLRQKDQEFVKHLRPVIEALLRSGGSAATAGQ